MPFVQGQSGNPGGKPKERPFRDALMMEIAKAGEDRKALRAVAAKLLEKAEQGDIQAIKEIADRMDGKVPQAIEGGDEPIKTENVFRWLSSFDEKS